MTGPRPPTKARRRRPREPETLERVYWAAVLADCHGPWATEATSSLDCEMGGIAYALNGVVFYSGAVGNCPHDPPCPQLDIRRGRVDLVRLLFRAQLGHRRLPLPLSAVVFDCASQQGSAHQRVDTRRRSAGRRTASPIYGPLGPGGVEIRNCGAAGASRPTARTSAAATRASWTSTTTSTATTSRAKSAT